MNMQGDKYGDWVEAKDYDQLELDFAEYKTWAEERIETLQHDLRELNYMYEGLCK